MSLCPSDARQFQVPFSSLLLPQAIHTANSFIRDFPDDFLVLFSIYFRTSSGVSMGPSWLRTGIILFLKFDCLLFYLEERKTTSPLTKPSRLNVVAVD